MRASLVAVALVLVVSAKAYADDAQAAGVSKADFQVPEGLSPLRQKVIEAALGEVGKVSSRPGQAQGGKRKGGDRLAVYIKSAMNWTDKQVPADWKKKIDAIQTPTKAGTRPHEVNNWCGYFATWALKTGGAPASLKWMPSVGIKKAFKKTTKQAKILGCRTDWENMKPGDVGMFSKASHHALIAEVNGNDYKTIDGNGEYGEVGIHQRAVKTKAGQHIVCFLSLDDLT